MTFEHNTHPQAMPVAHLRQALTRKLRSYYRSFKSITPTIALSRKEYIYTCVKYVVVCAMLFFIDLIDFYA